jgi:hypothetical protein
LSTANRNRDALAVYQRLLEKNREPGLHAMAAVMAGRLKDKDGARRHLRAIPPGYGCPTTSYNVACALAVLGDVEGADRSLRRAFQLTPPSELAGLKKQAGTDTDLASLRGTPAFATALKTESLVSDKAPVKAGCAGCPSKGSCSEEKSGGCSEEKKTGKESEKK